MNNPTYHFQQAATKLHAADGGGGADAACIGLSGLVHVGFV
eukprot:SAG22_NODE_6754_length_815_cov_1.832402_1_plen_41_part_00